MRLTFVIHENRLFLADSFFSDKKCEEKVNLMDSTNKNTNESNRFLGNKIIENIAEERRTI